MKKSLIINAGWLLAVGGAFWLGSQRPGEDHAVANEEQARTKTLREVGPSGAVGATAADRADRRGTERGRGDDGATDATWGYLAETAVRDPNPVNRRLAFTRLLESLTAENARDIRSQLVAFGADGEMWDDFNYAWGALAGREAFEFGLESPERDMEAALMGWAATNPREVLALFNNPPEEWGGDRNRFAESIVAGIAQTDRALATDLVYQLAGEGNDRAGRLMARVAREALRTGGLDEATAWSESLADGPLKGAALDRVAGTYVRQDAEAAARWVERFADQDYAARAVREVGEEWAERDPVTAVTWLEGLPEGPGQASGLSAAFGDWEDRDPVAAGEYLLAMPESTRRDAAISGFSRGYAWQDPQTAIAWAQDISDPQLRERTLTQAGQAFMRRDPEGARQWLANSGLSEAAQREVVRGRRR